MLRAVALLLAGVAAVAGCGSAGGTGIIVEVAATPEVQARIDTVRIQVWNGEPGRPIVEESFPVWEGTVLKLPARLGLRPADPDEAPTLRIEASGLQGLNQQRRAIAQTTVTFRPSEVMRVQLVLGAYCAGGCAPEQVCLASGSCAPVGPTPAAEGGASPDPDGGAGAGPADGGGAVDAAPTPDAAASPEPSPSPPPPPPMGTPDPSPKLTLGAACQGHGNCESNACIEGVCCDSSCEGACRSCLARHTGSGDGVCAPVSAGRDPDIDCPGQPAMTCGNAGTCDGAGACRRHPAGTACAASTCAANRFTPAAACNGEGACLPATAIDCGLYRCSGAGCLLACDGHEDCSDTGFCDRDRCAPRKTGGPCSVDRECLLGLACLLGVCV